MPSDNMITGHMENQRKEQQIIPLRQNRNRALLPNGDLHDKYLVTEEDQNNQKPRRI